MHACCGTSPTRCLLFHGALLALAISKRAQCRPLQYPDLVYSTKVRESGKEVWRVGAGESFAGHMFREQVYACTGSPRAWTGQEVTDLVLFSGTHVCMGGPCISPLQWP